MKLTQRCIHVFNYDVGKQNLNCKKAAFQINLFFSFKRNTFRCKTTAVGTKVGDFSKIHATVPEHVSEHLKQKTIDTLIFF